jgi:hypothetical protein
MRQKSCFHARTVGTKRAVTRSATLNEIRSEIQRPVLLLRQGDDKALEQPARCKAMFAELSNYLDTKTASAGVREARSHASLEFF